MKRIEANVGIHVVSLRDFACVPKGTEGVIDEDYGTGVMIAWDLPEQPLPPMYSKYDGKPTIQTNILRDGFDKTTELDMLQVKD